MGRQKIIFRADGNAKMGLGHVIRSLALADMLKDDFDCHFIIRDPLPTLKEQILEVCSSIEVLNNTNDDLEESKIICDTYLRGNEIVVLDGYHFRTQYQQNIKDKGCKVVCIDDIHEYHFVADAIINHSGGLLKENYSTSDETNIYLGLKFALLRKPFRDCAQRKELKPKKNNMFICFGGADPKNDTLEAIKACEQSGFIEKCFVVLGVANKYTEEINRHCNLSSMDVEILYNLNEFQMLQYMELCSYAFTPPSSISYEYMSTGGLLFLTVIADNQKNMYDYFTSNRLAFDRKRLKDKIDYKKTLELQKSCFDGQQEERLLNIFREYGNGH